MSNILNQQQIKSIKKSGKILAAVLEVVSRTVGPGISTFEIDQIAEETIRKYGAFPAFKNYDVKGVGKYPAAICASVNDQVVHGLPDSNVILKEGDIISIDIGVKFEGLCTDAARTYGIGRISDDVSKLITTTKECLARAINVAEAGAKIGKIGQEVQKIAESNGFGVIRDLVGHGIGPEVHLSPQIPNFGNGSLGPVIVEGMALAIEPMLTAGDYRLKTGKDGWTIVTADGSLAAHFEDTVIIENGKATVVTR